MELIGRWLFESFDKPLKNEWRCRILSVGHDKLHNEISIC